MAEGKLIVKNAKGVIFDLDGTLVDSMNVWKEIDVSYLGKHGYDAVSYTHLNSKEALSCIRQNLEKTHLADRAIVIGQDCAGAIHALDAKKMHFDIIFMDPPYQLNACLLYTSSCV